VTALYDPKHGNPQEKTARRESDDEAAPLIRGYMTRLITTQFVRRKLTHYFRFVLGHGFRGYASKIVATPRFRSTIHSSAMRVWKFFARFVLSHPVPYTGTIYLL
jgi:hypothetical protein